METLINYIDSYNLFSIFQNMKPLPLVRSSRVIGRTIPSFCMLLEWMPDEQGESRSTNLFIRVNHILFYSIAIIICSCGKHTAQDWFVFPVVIFERLLFFHDLSLIFIDFLLFIYRLYNLYNNYRERYSLPCFHISLLR